MFATGVETTVRPRKIKRRTVRLSQPPRSGLQALLRYLDHSCYLEDYDTDLNRFRPSSLDVMIQDTNFTRLEVKRIYQGFKQECPSGFLEKRAFRRMYQNYFPEGDAALYADLLFRKIDDTKKGNINFEDFLRALSVLSRGTLAEQLEWTFSLYDVNGDGYISANDLYHVVCAIYQLTTKAAVPEVEQWERRVHAHIHYILQSIDTSTYGLISHQEFIDNCMKNEHILASLPTFFNTAIC